MYDFLYLIKWLVHRFKSVDFILTIYQTDDVQTLDIFPNDLLYNIKYATPRSKWRQESEVITTIDYLTFHDLQTGHEDDKYFFLNKYFLQVFWELFKNTYLHQDEIAGGYMYVRTPITYHSSTST